MHTRFRGLIAAPFTPFNEDLTVNYDVIPTYAALLKKNGVQAAFVCGTTGEGASLTQEERKKIAETWIKEASATFRVIVHVGHNSLPESQALSRHAASAGAAAIATLAPSFFRPRNHEELFDWCAQTAAVAPHTPFYYYNIPSMTGVSLKVAPLLEMAAERIPSFAGVKYTHDDLEDFAACVAANSGRFDLLFGRDELLMEGWSHQARGAVGSTYNYAAPLYLQLIEKLGQGKSAEARVLQDKAIQMIALCNAMGVTHLAASKSVMGLLGVPCGPTRAPLSRLPKDRLEELRRKLEAMDFFSTACKPI